MEWQPIDTAPKDGTPILGFATTKADDFYSNDGVAQMYWKNGWYCQNNYPFSPTHWMPLPNPPEQA